MTSSSPICIVPSASEGMKIFFTTGTGPCTSYNPNLRLKAASPNSAPTGSAAQDKLKSQTFVAEHRNK